jgi:hypothetical protein
MPKFLIEVPHEPTEEACDKAVRIFLNTGSHFLTNADWGCHDGDHTAWFFIEIEDKEHARNIVPPAFRPQARIIQLNKFSFDSLDNLKASHS